MTVVLRLCHIRRERKKLQVLLIKGEKSVNISVLVKNVDSTIWGFVGNLCRCSVVCEHYLTLQMFPAALASSVDRWEFPCLLVRPL